MRHSRDKRLLRCEAIREGPRPYSAPLTAFLYRPLGNFHARQWVNVKAE
jgi:hypothetical protein